MDATILMLAVIVVLAGCVIYMAVRRPGADSGDELSRIIQAQAVLSGRFQQSESSLNERL